MDTALRAMKMKEPNLQCEGRKGEKFRVYQSGDGWWVWVIHSMTLFKKYVVWMYELRLALRILGDPTINKTDGISIWTMPVLPPVETKQKVAFGD